MQTRNRNTFTTIHTEGALLPVDLLQRIRSNDSALEGLTPESYHLAPGEKLNEAINRSWNRLNGLWGTFKAARERLGKGDLGTTLTRERWLLQIFQELGFGRLSVAKAVEIEGKSYPISHRWQTANAVVPLHLVGCGIELDKRTPGAAGAARVSPHSLLQEYLNRADNAQWGVASNGLGLRILRDNATLTRQAYIEFDLESIFEGEIYSDFVLLWLICHQSRFENSEQQAECVLERWSKSAQESGTRALDDLRAGVEEAIVSLGQGFLQHPLNNELRTHLKQGDLSAQDYYRQLLRLVYRLIFLFAAEDRDLLLLPATDASVEARQRFQKYYSTTRLRALAERQRGSRHHDRYEALRLVMTLLGSDQGCPELAIPALGGFLFDARSTADLNQARLGNQALLSAVRSLAFISEGNTRRAVDYRNLGPEELGSVYESLLELHPLLNTDAGTFQLTSAAGNERKTTGSYYTPSSLIQVLLDSALDPVIEDRLKGKAGAVEQEQALLSLKVCDPACGSGHFLIAAAHRITGKLAEVRAGGNEPSPNENRRALRDVIRHCIYGVDINPMSVELCKVNLWLESIEPGKPLSFLDAHIKCGNSLVGIGPGVDIDEIPDEAFNGVSGDDKQIARETKNRNKAEGAGQLSFSLTVLKTLEELHDYLARQTRALEILPEDTSSQVQTKASAYLKLQNSQEFSRRKSEYDLWTSAFFWKHEKRDDLNFLAPTQGELRKIRQGLNISKDLAKLITDYAKELNFFHWELEFPEVFNESERVAKDMLPVELKPQSNPSKPTSMPVTPYVSEQLIQKVKNLSLQIKDPYELLWQSINDSQLMNAPFERQANVAGELIEFYCPQAQVVVNLLTGKEPRQAAKKNQDAIKKLKKYGVRVVTVWELALRSAPETELMKIATALAEVVFNPRHQSVLHSERLIQAVQEPDGVMETMPSRKSGFDCVLGNPPWERIKLQEEEFFAQRDPQIAAAPNKAARERLIKALYETNPALAQAFNDAKHAAECSSKFMRTSERFPLTAVGDMNTYALFAEHFRALMNARGRAGVIVPTGIATDDTTKNFFGDLVEKRAIASLFDFENKEAIFPGVHRSYKFCLLTLSEMPINQAQFMFFATRVEHLHDNRRRFTLDPAEIALFNPNTRTMPIFRTRMDAELTRAIYRRVPVLVNDHTGENQWGVSFLRMFDMSNDSGLFASEPREGYVRLYEGKMIQAYDHRAARVVFMSHNSIRQNQPVATTLEQYRDPNYIPSPLWWVSQAEVEKKLFNWTHHWVLGFKDVTSATNERTAIFTIMPRVAIGHKVPLIFLDNVENAVLYLCFIGNTNSLEFDTLVRQKVGGLSLAYFILKQLPTLSPKVYRVEDINFITPRVIELINTANDLRSFAQEMGYKGEPFSWDEDRRAVLRAELDAYYARLYGLNRKQLRYILDPADLTPRELEDILDPWEEMADALEPAGYAARVAASDFPGETFRVLKDKEMRLYGEYRTRRLVLEAWNRLEGIEIGNPDGYQEQSDVVTPQQKTIAVPQPKPESRSAAAQSRLPTPPSKPTSSINEVEEPAAQPTLTDFGLYKCEACGKLVMGYEKESHEREKHNGKSVEWKKLK